MERNGAAGELSAFLSSQNAKKSSIPLIDMDKINCIVHTIYGAPKKRMDSDKNKEEEEELMASYQQKGFSKSYDTSMLNEQSKHELFIQEIIKCVSIPMTTTQRLEKSRASERWERRFLSTSAVPNKINPNTQRSARQISSAPANSGFNSQSYHAAINKYYQEPGRLSALTTSNYSLSSATSTSKPSLIDPRKPKRASTAPTTKKKSLKQLPQRPLSAKNSLTSTRLSVTQSSKFNNSIPREEEKDQEEVTTADDHDSIHTDEVCGGEESDKPKLPIEMVRDVNSILLRKQKRPLSKREFSLLHQKLKTIPAFLKQEDFVLKELSKVIKLVKYEKGRAVFRQGDQGTSWFVILSGMVSVNVATSSGGPNGGGMVKEVARLYPGTGFGDLALLNDQPRTATILCLKKTRLLRIDREDYTRTIKFSHERTVKEKILFLRQMQPFCGYSTADLRRIAELIKWETFPANTILLNEGDETKYLYFIRKGECQATKSTIVDGCLVVVKLSSIQSSSYFGQWSIRNEGNLCPVSIRTTEETEVGTVSIVDIMQYAHTGLPYSYFETLDPDMLPTLYREQQAKDEFLRFKRSFLTALIRETHHDPNITLEKLNDKKQERWHY